jgi:PAS domain S-box-containing protein
MPERHQLLMVESSMRDAFLIVTELEQAGLEFEFERVETAAHMDIALATKTWDLIICEAELPDFDWLEALAIYKAKGLDIPFILVSGMGDEDLASQRIKAGVHEEVLKDNLARLPLAVKRQLRSAEERRVHQQGDARQIAALAESSDRAIIGTNLEGTILSCNRSAEGLLGYGAAEMVGHAGTLLVPAYRQEDWARVLQRIGEGGPVESYDTAWLCKNGTAVEVELAVFPVKDANKKVVGASIVAHNITSRRLEEDDRRALIQELVAATTHTDTAMGQTQGKK